MKLGELLSLSSGKLITGIKIDNHTLDKHMRKNAIQKSMSSKQKAIHDFDMSFRIIYPSIDGWTKDYFEEREKIPITAFNCSIITKKEFIHHESSDDIIQLKELTINENKYKNIPNCYNDESLYDITYPNIIGVSLGKSILCITDNNNLYRPEVYEVKLLHKMLLSDCVRWVTFCGVIPDNKINHALGTIKFSDLSKIIMEFF